MELTFGRPGIALRLSRARLAYLYRTGDHGAQVRSIARVAASREGPRLMCNPQCCSSIVGHRTKLVRPSEVSGLRVRPGLTAEAGVTG